MFHLFTGIAYLFVLWRFVVPLPWPRSARVLLALLLLVASKYHFLILLTTENMFSPEIPFWLAAVMGWAFCTFVLLFLLTVLADVALGISALLARRRTSRRALGRSRLLSGAVAAIAALVGTYQAVQVPEVKRVELELPGWPAQLDGYRLVQLTDLHISRLFPKPWAAQVVARTNALHADLIVITGDLIDGTTQARREDVAPLQDLAAKQGVIAIPGNHEYYFDEPAWQGVFEGMGMRYLTNAQTQVGEGERAFTVAGVTDPVALRFGAAGPDLAAALKGAPANEFKLLLSHRPIDMQTNAEAGVGLQLSGHTHGGMIKGFDKLIAKANGGFVSGLYQIGALQLYVSNGTGLWNGFPIRLGVPAEITEFVLHPKRAE